MFDSALRPLIDPPLNAMGRALARRGISANALTLTGLLLGLARAWLSPSGPGRSRSR